MEKVILKPYFEDAEYGTRGALSSSPQTVLNPYYAHKFGPVFEIIVNMAEIVCVISYLGIIVGHRRISTFFVSGPFLLASLVGTIYSFYSAMQLHDSPIPDPSIGLRLSRYFALLLACGSSAYFTIKHTWYLRKLLLTNSSKFALFNLYVGQSFEETFQFTFWEVDIACVCVNFLSRFVLNDFQSTHAIREIIPNYGRNAVLHSHLDNLACFVYLLVLLLTSPDANTFYHRFFWNLPYLYLSSHAVRSYYSLVTEFSLKEEVDEYALTKVDSEREIVGRAHYIAMVIHIIMVCIAAAFAFVRESANFLLLKIFLICVIVERGILTVCDVQITEGVVYAAQERYGHMQ